MSREYVSLEETCRILGMKPEEIEQYKYRYLTPVIRGGDFFRDQVEALHEKLTVRASVRKAQKVPKEFFGIISQPRFRRRQADCPTCGAPNDILGQGRLLRCDFCIGQFVLERRLTVPEPIVPGSATDRSRWDDFSAEEDKADCPGCGKLLAFEGLAAIVRCTSCGKECSIERRCRPEPLPLKEADDKETNRLVDFICAPGDLLDRIEAAARLESWSYINATLARRMPDILRVIQKDDRRLGTVLSDCVSKLLNQNDPRLRNHTVHAAEAAVFDDAGSQVLLFEIGMGSAVCLKLLMDVAEWASRYGAVGYSCAALSGATWIWQRNYQEHSILTRIVLHRLMYLEGAVAAWALKRLQDPIVKMRPDDLFPFIDDCVEERPDLVPDLLQCLPSQDPKDTKTYRHGVGLLKKMRTPLGRSVVAQWLGQPPTLLSKLFRPGEVPKVEPPPADDEKRRKDLLLWKEGMEHSHEISEQERDNARALSSIAVWRTPLQIAVCKDQVKEVEAILKKTKKADLQETNRAGLTALFIAIRLRKPEMVRLIVKRGADVKWTDNNHRCALGLAAEIGFAEAVPYLFKKSHKYHREGAFNTAHEKGHASVLRELYRAGQKPDREEIRTIDKAAEAGHTEVVRVMLEAKTNPDHADYTGDTALLKAARSGNSEMVEVLLKHGADASKVNRDKETALILAVQNGHTETVKQLIPHSSLDKVGPKKKTALGWARENGHDDAAALLVEALRDLKPAAEALFAAVTSERTAEVRELLDRGGDPNSVDEAGGSLIVASMRRENGDVIRMLLDAGADPNRPDQWGDHALRTAITYHMEEEIRLLLKHGADVDIRDRHGYTPLMRAAQINAIRTMEILLEHGADLHAKDREGYDALWHAKNHRRKEAEEWLTSRRS